MIQTEKYFFCLRKCVLGLYNLVNLFAILSYRQDLFLILTCLKPVVLMHGLTQSEAHVALHKTRQYDDDSDKKMAIYYMQIQLNEDDSAASFRDITL